MSKNKKQRATAVTEKSPLAENKDKSLHVPQRDKIKESLKIKELPWTDKQKDYLEQIFKKENSIIILDGPPGTSKTSLAMYSALKLMSDKRVSELLYIRSTIQAKDGETGFLTGNLEEKMQFFNVPLMDKLEEFLPSSEVAALIKEHRIIAYPTSMLRGYNFNANAIVFDEGQNATFDSILTVATRVGRFSKLFILGDSRYQNDLGKNSGFLKFIKIFNDQKSRDNGIVYLKFDTSDIMRSGVVRFIMEKIEEEAAKRVEPMFPNHH